jgi:hypothetical protein
MFHGFANRSNGRIETYQGNPYLVTLDRRLPAKSSLTAEKPAGRTDALLIHGSVVWLFGYIHKTKRNHQ